MNGLLRTLCLLIMLFVLSGNGLAPAETTTASGCQPTPEDEMGPFYRPGAALRSQIGSGYLLSGQVKSAADCAPLGHALIEFWQAGPNGQYSDAYRAAVITGMTGYYQLETTAPPAYFTRPPHIHIRVSAKNHQTLVTQHYLQPGTQQAGFDLVLVPQPTPAP